MKFGRICSVFLAAASCALACTDIPTGDNAVLAIAVDTLAAPAVVVGDSLRDSTGKAVPLTASVYNFKGNLVSSAQVRFHALDRGITVDSVTGFVTGDSVRDTPARIVINVGSLQALQQLLVTVRPDTVFAVNGRDSLAYSLVDTTKNISPALSVRVRHTLTTDSAVKNYLVSFAITSTSDTTLAKLVNDAGVSSRIDTTDANGEAARKIRLNVVNLKTANDSIIVSASVKYRGVNVKGSPVRLVMKVKPGA
ncbi:MAG TPA: hypothetical protein VNC11_09335 [Gemmatimonadaceae bacterium]|nr:hypothetical protein [Gemmatimonadaceae bacterium]